MPHVRVMGRFVREYGGLTITTRQRPNNDLFLRAAYRAFLMREPDE